MYNCLLNFYGGHKRVDFMGLYLFHISELDISQGGLHVINRASVRREFCGKRCLRNSGLNKGKGSKVRVLEDKEGGLLVIGQSSQCLPSHLKKNISHTVLKPVNVDFFSQYCTGIALAMPPLTSYLSKPVDLCWF
jgi:hypothetical protein